MRIASLFLIGLLAVVAQAGTIYEVTSTDGNEKVTYKVKFGGGKVARQYTAYDPKSKEFVYLTWKQGDPEPKPVSTIWDHKSGDFIDLYKFPKVEQPLPVIPSIKEMKTCPKTGDKNFSFKRVGNYD